LDEEKLALLRRWGEGLTVDDREEVRAAGRAILMLSDEIERLHIDLWHARDPQLDESEERGEAVGPAEPAAAAEEPQSEPGLGAALKSRIAAFSLSRSTNR
jgi:hypothetical protein